MWFGVFILLLGSTLWSCTVGECPEPETVYPCYCEEDDDVMHCNHFYEADQIYTAVKGMEGHRIDKMSFFMNRILEPVRKDAFKGTNVEKIVFENSTITLSSPQFEGMEEHLLSIQLRACFNKTNPLGTWSLGHLSNLKELILDKNRILKLPDEWLESAPPSLKTLMLEEDSIVSLGDHAFAKIEHLTFLVLDGNRITWLERSMFPNPAPDLRSITLNNNRLRSLNADLFKDMPQLRIFEATNNLLQILGAQPWAALWNRITKLDLTGNPIECTRTMKWMFEGESKPILLYGECAEPARLKGKSLKQLKPDELNETKRR